jgi:hypothetical protein
MASAPVPTAFAASETIAAIATGRAVHVIAGTTVAAFATAFALGTIGARGALAIGRAIIPVFPAARFRSRTRSAGLGNSIGRATGGSAGAGFFGFVNLYGLELKLRGHLLDDGLFQEVDNGADFREDVNAEANADDR